MTTWVDPAANKTPLFGGTVDVVTTATPLAMMKSGDLEALSQYSIMDMCIFI